MQENFKEELTHQEKLEYWKKYDPIHYSEMTSDPCGHNTDSSWFGIIIFLLAVITFLIFIF